MGKTSLASSNQYLRDRTTYRRDLVANVASSTAIETGQRVHEVFKRLSEDIKDARLIDATRAGVES